MRAVFACTAIALLSSIKVVFCLRTYDKHKVVRLFHEDNTAEIGSIISSLGLATWQSGKDHGYSDVVVTPAKLDEFASKTAHLKARKTLHEDLGASIANESAFATYDGKDVYMKSALYYFRYVKKLTLTDPAT